MNHPSNRGVSPILAVLLLVSVTVILSVVVGTFALQGVPTEPAPEQSSVIVTRTDAGTHVIPKEISGNSTLVVLRGGTRVGTLNKSDLGDEIIIPTAPEETVKVVEVSETSTNRVIHSSAGFNPSMVSDYEFAETSGSTVNDRFERNPARTTSSVTLNADGVNGSGVKFSESGNGHISISDNVLSRDETFMVSIWVNTTSDSGTILDAVGSGTPFSITYTSDTITWTLSDRNGRTKTLSSSVSPSVDSGDWHHIAAVGQFSPGSNPARFSLYFDGSKIAKWNASGDQWGALPSFTKLRLGHSTRSHGQFIGQMDELAFSRGSSDQFVKLVCESDAPPGHPCSNSINTQPSPTEENSTTTGTQTSTSSHPNSNNGNQNESACETGNATGC